MATAMPFARFAKGNVLMKKIAGRFSVGLIAVCIMAASFIGCAGETSPDPPAEPAEVQKLRGDQAAEPQTPEAAADESAE